MSRWSASFFLERGQGDAGVVWALGRVGSEKLEIKEVGNQRVGRDCEDISLREMNPDSLSETAARRQRDGSETTARRRGPFESRPPHTIGQGTAFGRAAPPRRHFLPLVSSLIATYTLTGANSPSLGEDEPPSNAESVVLAMKGRRMERCVNDSTQRVGQSQRPIRRTRINLPIGTPFECGFFALSFAIRSFIPVVCSGYLAGRHSMNSVQN